MYLERFVHRSQRSAGFGMIEILVTLVVVAIGLLGLAAMQATAISNTSVARMRGIAAMQANSIIAAIGANPGYWGAGTTALSFVILGSTATSSTATTKTTVTPWPATYTDCTAASCSAAQMAAFDMAIWGQNLYQQLGQGSAVATQNATISCPVPAANTPVACTITIYWTEKNLVPGSASGAVSALPTYDYQVVVQP